VPKCPVLVEIASAYPCLRRDKLWGELQKKPAVAKGCGGQACEFKMTGYPVKTPVKVGCKCPILVESAQEKTCAPEKNNKIFLLY